MGDPKTIFAAPPILPWFRADSKKPLKSQLSKARVLKGVTLRAGGLRGPLKFPELRLLKPAAGAKKGK